MKYLIVKNKMKRIMKPDTLNVSQNEFPSFRSRDCCKWKTLQRKTRCTEVKRGFKVIIQEWKTYTLLKSSNTPFIMLPISSLIIIWAILNSQYIKYKAFKGIISILKKKPNSFKEILF